MRLQGAIFDMDGTLLDSMPAWRGTGPEILREMGLNLSREKLAPFARLEVCGAAAYLREVCGLSRSEEFFRQEMRRRMAAFYAARVRPKPGVPALLSRWRAQGVGLYVATATQRPLAETALKTAGILDFFQGIVTAEEAGASKRESAEIYELALEGLNCHKAAAVVFEDALYAARTAKGAGFRVAAVYEGTMARDQAALRDLCDYYLPSFEDLAALSALERGEAAF